MTIVCRARPNSSFFAHNPAQVFSLDRSASDVTEADEEMAWASYREDVAGGAGIVDHISFTVMRRLEIRQAFTNDRHFVEAGFEVLF